MENIKEVEEASVCVSFFINLGTTHILLCRRQVGPPPHLYKYSTIHLRWNRDQDSFCKLVPLLLPKNMAIMIYIIVHANSLV